MREPGQDKRGGVRISVCSARRRKSTAKARIHTARKLAGAIEKIKGDGGIRAQTAVAAALVHDVGYGPFSHAFEEVLKKLRLGKHEVRSVWLIPMSRVSSGDRNSNDQ